MDQNRYLEWSFAECLLVWEAPRALLRDGDIYLRLWGLVQTVNTTVAEYEQQLEVCRNGRKKEIIRTHLQAKMIYYPQDDFPLIAFHPTRVSYQDLCLRRGDTLAVTFCFGGEHVHLAADWLQWFAVRLTLENTGFSLKNKPKLMYRRQMLPQVMPDQQAIDAAPEMVLLLDMPANLTLSQSLLSQFQEDSEVQLLKRALLYHCQKRLGQWFVSQQGLINAWFDKWQEILLASPVYMYQLYERHNIQTRSKSTPRSLSWLRQNNSIHYHQGYAGYLTLQGAWSLVLELWQVLGDIHLLGQRTQINGLGYFLDISDRPKDWPTLWQQRVVNREAIYQAVVYVGEREDALLLDDEIAQTPDEGALATQVYQVLKNHKYRPSATYAHSVLRPYQGIGLTEEMTLSDQVVHRLLAYVLRDAIYQIQAPWVIDAPDWQKMAADRVDALLQSGFDFMIEIDNAAFLNDVQWPKLWPRLAAVLPKREVVTLNLVRSLMEVPYVMTKRAQAVQYRRRQGLIATSPLSPLLLQVYLSMLDEAANQEVAVLRLKDDVLLFCRHAKDRRQAVQVWETWLLSLGFHITINDIDVKALADGFEWLGQHFVRGQDDLAGVVPVLWQRKPLIVAGSCKYLGVRGETIEIQKKSSATATENTQAVGNRTLLQAIPLRRISQLVVMGNHRLSSPLLSACAKNNISVHMVNRWGFQIGTFAPSNADFYATSAKQYQRFKALTYMERLAIARALVATKINNYQVWIGNSYHKGDADFIKALDAIAENVSQSDHIEMLLGYEGQAAKLCFKRLQNIVIQDQKVAFQSSKRSRGGKDRLNSLLNFGYYWLFTRISSLLHSHGLNPYLSYLHAAEQDYETLTYDIMEVFRVHVDKTVIRLINRKQIQADDFQLDSKKGWQLNYDALNLFINQLQATFASQINHAYLDDIILMQVRTVYQWAVDNQPLLWFCWHKENKKSRKLLEQQRLIQ